jgi:iron complex transport system permease protein
MTSQFNRWPPAFLAISLLLLGIFGIALGSSVGSTRFESWFAAFQDEIAWQIIWDIRLPRSVGAFVAGALLGLAGAIAQGLFRNPLADPYLLGSASGASLGVAIALALFGGNPFAAEFLIRLGLTGAAFIGAVLAVMLTIALAQGVQHTLRLLLAGVIVGVVLGAMASLISLLRPDVLQGMQGFLLGSTSFIGWNSCALMFGVLLVCMGLAFFLSRVLDALSLGELTALSLGMPLAKARLVLVTLLALATGAAVAQTGLVAFVGLAAPHLVRSLIKTKYNWVILLSTLMGGLLLLLADLLARLLLSPQELPVGVLTAVLGGGYLLWLMYQSQKKAAVG